MKIQIAVLLTLILFISARGPVVHSDEQSNVCSLKYQIEQNENPTTKHGKNGKIRIIYEDYSEMSSRFEKEVVAKKIQPESASRIRKSLPKGGAIYILLYRADREEANLEKFNYIFKINNKEVQTQDGAMYSWKAVTRPGNPSHIGEDGEYYTDVDMMKIEKPIMKGEIGQLVIRGIKGSRDEFLIKFLR